MSSVIYMVENEEVTGVMRKSREAAAESNARITQAASRLVRARGFEATGVADVMQAAGMTNGGFYRHFESKNDMVSAAIRAAFDELVARFDHRLEQNGAAAAIDAYVTDYLSDWHLLHPEQGCPVAAVGADAGRSGGAFADQFVEGAERLIRRLATGSGDEAGTRTDRDEAIRRLAALVGAVVVARAVGPGDLREEILAACRAS